MDGVDGTLIQQRLNSHAPQYILIWMKDGILYALTGSGSSATALEIAGSLK